MDVGQSPIQFIDQPGTNSRTPNSYYYGNSNNNNNQLPSTSSIGALSTRLHQLRPAGSVPFSSRTNPNQISSTIPRQKPIPNALESDLSGYQYNTQTLPLVTQYSTNKSISTQNLSSIGNQYYSYRDRMPLDNQMIITNPINERPRPASARDPGFTDLMDMPTPQQRRLYETLYTPRHSQTNQQKLNASRFRQQRSSSFDYERDPALMGSLRPQIPLPPPMAQNIYPAPMMGSNPGYDYHFPMIDNVIMDYQTDLFSIQRELAKCQQELELTKEKLTSSVNSIKSFWSPELKRERSMRKDENSKYVLLAEELHQLQMEKKTMLSNVHQLETELRREKELRNKHSQTAQEIDLLYRRCDELEKENRILTKQSEEYEKRMISQKESLVTAEENIRKLLEVVKVAKSASSGHSALQGLRLERFEEDQTEIERLRSQIHEYSQRTIDLERAIVEKDFDISRNKEQGELLNQEVQNLRQENEHIRQDIQQTQTLQSLVDTKESKILTLENEIRLLEDELARMRDEELITPTTSVNGIDDYEKNMRSTVRPHERLMKSKLEALSCEISKRDSEIYSLQSRLEMAEKQHQDQNHHINVLKEQVKTREHKISMMMADVEDFRKRLKEKETLLEKKSQILTSSQTEKHQTESEILDLKDQCEMKDKKISLLQRKVQNLEDLLNDKENQLTTAKSKLLNLHTEHSTTEGTKAGLEESLRDRERQLERLKESKTRMEHEFQDELEMQKKLVSETKSRLDNSERELREKVAMLNEMREELSELRAVKFKRESELNTIQVQCSQKTSEVAALQLELQTVRKQYISDTEYKSNHRISELESQINHYSDSATRLQGEVDRLLNMVRNLESEKLEKDRQITQLECQVKEHQNTISNMKRTHQNERNYLNEDIDVLKRKEDNILVDMEVIKTTLTERENRIKELEQALRESLQITAERESYVHNKEDSYRQLELKISDQKQNLEIIQKERNQLSGQLASAQEELREKETQLKTLESECFQNYIPELDRQRKSNQELVLRVQALVKIIQGREFQLSEQERISLTELGLYPDTFAHRGYPSTGRISAGPYSTGYNNYSKVTWSMGSYPISHTSALMGGSVPHINSPGGLGMHRTSAFHSTLGHTDEMTHLGRLLHEKEQMLHQQMEDISRLRLQNSELEAKLKAMEDRITSSSYYSSKLTGGTEFAVLQHQNTELTSKVTYLKNILEEKEDKIKTLSTENRTNFLQMEIERIKREMNSTIADKDTHISILASDLEKVKQEKTEVNNNLIASQLDVKEKTDKIRFMESEQSKMNMDREALQKKYQTALNHLSEKSEKIENLEREIFQKQADEIKKLKLENEENSHRLSFMQKSLSDRDGKIEHLEKEHYKLRDEVTALQKQNHNSENEIKRLRDELTYREQRLKQIQNDHSEEISQLRATTMENTSRVSQLRHSLEEKDQILKSKISEIEKSKGELEISKRRLRDKDNDMARITNDLAEKDTVIKSLERDYNDEVQRHQKANEDASSRINLIQKRVEEREARLRKIEQENNELLDEIHNLRKRNHEIESNLDVMKQQLLEKDECILPTSRSSSVMDMGYNMFNSHTINGTYTSHKEVPVSASINQEIDKLKKQNQDVLNSNLLLQKEVDEASLQNDRLAMDREFLSKQLVELQQKHDLIKKSLQIKEKEFTNRELEFTKLKSEDSNKILMINQEIMKQKNELFKELENRDLQMSELSREVENLQRQLIESENNLQARNIQIKELQNYVDQLIRERDDARLRASSTTGVGSSNFRMNSQENQRQLQQQIEKLTYDSDRAQKENRDLRNRIQELSRQLQETQTNCDTIVKDRDLLKEQLQNRGKENQIIQLSKEMERLHRAEETHNQQLQELQKNATEAEEELDRVRKECQKKLDASRIEHEKALNQLEKLQLALRDHQEQTERREEEISNSQQEESEKLKHQCANLSKKLITLQHEYETKERQIQQLTETLDHARKENYELQKAIDEFQNHEQQIEYELSNEKREYEKLSEEKKELEAWACQMKDALNNKGMELTNLQQARGKSIDKQQMSLQNHISDLTDQLQMKEKQVDDLTKQLENANQEIREQEYLLQDLTQKLDSIQYDSKFQNVQYNNQTPSKGELDKIKEELASTKRNLLEKDQRIKLLETECFQQQADEIERLRKELKNLSNQDQRIKQSPAQQSPMSPSYSNNDMQSLKIEVDSLKRELNTKNDQIEKFERECQEKHLRRIDGLQLKLKRTEEEFQILERQIEELKRNLDERDKLVKQLKLSQHQATSVELERLREEYSRYQDEVNVKNQQIKTLERQINGQIKEILEIKQEALTASICEKDANIALLQMSGANNTHAQQAMQKLMNEKSQLQSQLKQLSSTRQKLQEEQNK